MDLSNIYLKYDQLFIMVAIFLFKMLARNITASRAVLMAASVSQT